MMEDLDVLRIEWARLLAGRPVGERTPEFVAALTQNDAEKRAFLTSLSPEVRRAVLGLSSPAESPGRRPPPPPSPGGAPPPPSRRPVSPSPRNRQPDPGLRGQPQGAPLQTYGAWLFSGVQAAAASVAPVVRNATAAIAPVASRTVQTCAPYAQAAVQRSQQAYSSIPVIIPPVVKASVVGVVTGVSQATVAAVQVGRDVAAHPEVPLAYIRGALLHNFGPQSEIPPAYAINLPITQQGRQPVPPPPPNFRNVDPSLLRADPPPDAAAQEGKEGRELGLEELLDFLAANYAAMQTIEQQSQGITIEEKLQKISQMSETNMAERGITEASLGSAFMKFEGNERVREIALKQRDFEQRLMAEVEVPSWLSAAKLLEIMRDLQEANREIFPQIVQAEFEGNMPPELMQRCVEINKSCYQKHGVTEMQLQTAMMQYQNDPTFTAQISAQQAEASNRAQLLVAQIQAQRA